MDSTAAVGDGVWRRKNQSACGTFMSHSAAPGRSRIVKRAGPGPRSHRVRHTMRWLRSRVRLGSWAALFALATQLTLSFGHCHVRSAQAGPASASRVLGVMIQLRTEQLVPPAVPAQHHPPTVADDFCAVCAVMQLVGVGAEPAVLALPGSIQRMKLVAGSEFAWAFPRHPFFHARAPPDA